MPPATMPRPSDQRRHLRQDAAQRGGLWPLFAGDPVTEHQPDECIDLERLVQNAQIIANAIVKLANLPLE